VSQHRRPFSGRDDDLPHAAGRTVVPVQENVRIAVRTIGRGRPLLLIPSHGRGSADYDELATMLSARGFMSILPEPRWIAGSTGPAPATLFDLADDLAGLVGNMCDGPVGVVGHAFGNRVARALATKHPGRISRVALLAGGGEVPIPPAVMAALEGAMAQGSKPDQERLQDLEAAFFARGGDPAIWLTGWHPEAAAKQMQSVRATPARLWWTAGHAPLLLVQAEEDPVAPPANAAALRRDVGSRLTLIDLRHASHAMLPEQPRAIAVALAGFFDNPPHTAPSLQRRVDKAVTRR
jgi:pimeloyl-ACP methyl ester carboxylesterase